MKRSLLVIALSSLPSLALGGGSWDRVTIEELKIDGSSYELVVTPQPLKPEYPDEYMGGCRRFTVKGSYSRIHAWRFPKFVNRASHAEALAYMQKAHAQKQPILLGWMGTGFVPIDPANKCVVRSRALQLWKDNEATAVVSYHNAV